MYCKILPDLCKITRNEIMFYHKKHKLLLKYGLYFEWGFAIALGTGITLPRYLSEILKCCLWLYDFQNKHVDAI